MTDNAEESYPARRDPVSREPAHDDEHPHPHDPDYGQHHDHDHADVRDHGAYDGHHGHNHPRGHDHPHPHTHDHDHEHDHGRGPIAWFRTIFHWHGHEQTGGGLATDQAFLHNEEGIRVVWLALAALLLTSLLQVVIVLISGSVALLADTIHNIGDGLNSIPLLIAFYLARRVATRRYTYGFGKAEDVAGVFIVLSIAVSAGVVFWESFKKFLDTEPMTNLGWVAAAAIIGFLGNEAVAVLQIRTGRKIGSAALVTDGLHARTDGLTSLSVLLATAGTWLGYPILDPIIGVLIGVAILFITRDAILAMWYRLMDAIEPEYLEQAERTIAAHKAVQDLRRVRLRWVGHRLHADVVVAVDPELTTAESHGIAEEVRHSLFHEIPTLSDIIVHVEPWSEKEDAFHRLTAGHEPVPRPFSK